MPLQVLNIEFRQVLEGSHEVTVDIPQSVLNDGDPIQWVKDNIPNLEEKALANGNISSEEFEVTEVGDLGEAE